MRISEVRGLQFGDIYEDDNGRYIKVRRTRVCINGHDTIQNRNKTELSTRDVPIPDYIYNLIQQIPHKNEDDFIISENYGALKRRYDRLLKKHDSYICRELLNCDIATDEGKAYARTNGLFAAECPKLIESAVLIAEKLINE